MTSIGKPFQNKIAFYENSGNELPLQTAVYKEATDRLCESTEKPSRGMSSKSSQWKSVIPVFVRDSPKENWLSAFSFATWMSCKTWGVLDCLWPTHRGQHRYSRSHLCDIVNTALTLPEGSTELALKTTALQEAANSGMASTRQV